MAHMTTNLIHDHHGLGAPDAVAAPHPPGPAVTAGCGVRLSDDRTRTPAVRVGSAGLELSARGSARGARRGSERERPFPVTIELPP
jgi:hypothetical protein